MSNKQISALFPSPLFKFQHPKAAELNASLWQDVCSLRSRSTREIAGHASQANWRSLNHSDWRSERNLFTRPEGSFQDLKAWVKQCSDEAAQQLWDSSKKHKYQPKMEAWANINGSNSLNGPHNHAGSHWSAVYYVRVPQASDNPYSGAIEFLDPRGHITNSALPDSHFFRPQHILSPKCGELLLFPAYLMHWVHPNKSEDERMSIAVNIRYEITSQTR